MLAADDMMAYDKEQLPEAVKTMDSSQLPRFVGLLSEKNDKIRYQAFLILQYRSRLYKVVYPFWEVFTAKLGSDNSYQRSIGMMLIADNARWDDVGKMAGTIGGCLDLLSDEKPITVRQCIQSLVLILKSKPSLSGMISQRLMAMDLSGIRDTMRRPILLDILNILAYARAIDRSEDIDRYMVSALTGGYLDAKSSKQAEALL